MKFVPKKVGMEKWKKKRGQEYLETKEYQYHIFYEGDWIEINYFLGFQDMK